MNQALTILFADVSGSTKLFETRGDLEARRLTSAILSALAEVTGRHGGRVIKTIGDEIMCTFPGPMQGLLGAVDMQKRIAHDPVFAKDNLAVRIGLHHGDTLSEDNDVYGDAVNTAARMASLAKREQIIATASTVRMLTNAGMLRTRSVGQARVAGKQLPIDIVDVTWQEDTSNVTMVQRAIRVDANGEVRVRLQLRYRGQAMELDELAPPFTLGRDATSSSGGRCRMGIALSRLDRVQAWLLHVVRPFDQRHLRQIRRGRRVASASRRSASASQRRDQSRPDDGAESGTPAVLSVRRVERAGSLNHDRFRFEVYAETLFNTDLDALRERPDLRAGRVTMVDQHQRMLA